MTDPATARPVPAGEGRVVQVGPLKLIWKEEGDATAGRLAVAELELAPGFSPPAHLHREHDEGFYVLEGQVRLTCGDEQFLAGPGDWLMVPVDVPHTFTNPGSTPARLLCTFSPNKYVEYFDRLEAAGREHGGPPPRGVFAALMADYATEMITDDGAAT